ncbi:MAG: hypothetical protein SWH68_08235 [Thermodesulfobacteriota bacterium]|nr:hypothetical protein [Thermodesulfobacteriota bacterium]
MSPQIFITSAGRITFNGKGKKPVLPVFRENQVIEARVLRVVSDQQAELSIAGRKVVANTRVPFSAGESVYLKAVGAGDKQRFVLTDAPRTGRGGRSETTVSPSTAYNQLSELLSGLLERAPERTDTRHMAALHDQLVEIAGKARLGDKGFLSMLISASGLVLEKKLLGWLLRGKNGAVPGGGGFVETDVKAALLSFAGAGDAPQAAKEILNLVERLQVFNKTSMEESGKLLLPLPFSMNGGLRFGELMVDLGRRPKDKKAADQEKSLLHISFILELSVLGCILADFSVFGNTVNGGFTVTTEEARHLLDSSVELLTGTLEARGFTLSRMDVQVTSKEQLSSLSLADRMKGKDGKDMLSIVI